MRLHEPFSAALNRRTGLLEPAGKIIKRRLSDMQGMYADTRAEIEILAKEGDRLIYEVSAAALPEEAGQVLHCTTIIYPGQVGAEYHMTKGHFHQKRDRGEVYFGLQGEGYVILQTDDDQVRRLRMEAGLVVYVPPLWAHRTVNTGAEPLIFLSAWPGDAGHDYGSIERRGFAGLILEREGEPVFVDNPNYLTRKDHR